MRQASRDELLLCWLQSTSGFSVGSVRFCPISSTSCHTAPLEPDHERPSVYELKHKAWAARLAKAPRPDWLPRRRRDSVNNGPALWPIIGKPNDIPPGEEGAHVTGPRDATPSHPALSDHRHVCPTVWATRTLQTHTQAPLALVAAAHISVARLHCARHGSSEGRQS